MKNRDFKMRERWHKKEQERFEHIEEKEAKRLEREKQEWLKECDKDIIDDSNNGKKEMEDEARQRLLALLKE
jgi:hypothetical protein